MLLAFESTARHSNFTKAAEELCLSQSAVSRQVQNLEQLLCADLFDRNGRNIKLSSHGELYLREISAAIQQVRTASARVFNSRQAGDSLRLAVLPMFASKWLMPRLIRFEEKYPDQSITLISRSNYFDLLQSDVHACISLNAPAREGVVTVPLIKTATVLIAHPDLLRDKPIHQASDVLCHRLLETTSSYFGWREACALSGLDLNRLALGSRYEYTAHLIQAVMDGLGIALVADMFVQAECRQGQLAIAHVPDLVLQDKHYSISYSHEDHGQAGLHRFVQWLSEEAAQS